MPRVKANSLTMNYDQQGSGEPLILIPYLSADYACYAFQVVEYSKHFTCISLDLRGTGESDASAGEYSTEVLADDVAGFMRAIGVEKAHRRGPIVGRGSGDVAGGEASAIGGFFVAAQRLAEDRFVHKNHHRDFPVGGQDARQRARDGDSHTLPMVPYTGSLRCEA